jgi:hypothetical protein
LIFMILVQKLYLSTVFEYLGAFRMGNPKWKTVRRYQLFKTDPLIIFSAYFFGSSQHRAQRYTASRRP